MTQTKVEKKMKRRSHYKKPNWFAVKVWKPAHIVSSLRQQKIHLAVYLATMNSDGLDEDQRWDMWRKLPDNLQDFWMNRAGHVLGRMGA